MKMNEYIKDFPNQLKNALDIGEKTFFSKPNQKINSVVICGLGGSGIGGTIANDVLSSVIKIPVFINKDYEIPKFVTKNTLVISVSYSGNTEETLHAIKECERINSEISCICSGGKLYEIAKENNYNFIKIPSGSPPRAMFAYSFLFILFTLHKYDLINTAFIEEVRSSIELIENESKNMVLEAQKIAKFMHKKTPVIYTASSFEGVGIRMRQQINENSKMLCWHNVVPEMNHNELLGWRINTKDLAVIFLRNMIDHQRTQARIEINKEVILKHTNKIIEVWSKGGSMIENVLYHIHLGDWVSWFLSVKNNVDAIEIDVINYLKNELAKIK